MRFQSYRNEGHWSPCVLCCRQPSPPSVGSKTANKNVKIQFGSVDDKIWEQLKSRLTTQKQQPSPPSISSQTGQQTKKQVPSLR
ncbi:hypothetical protein AAFF_G00169220 [Aldrovandia affinis]|uniref:Uncharacterized protein n=1 Tax=Aldrovandia affinis TaxID=143900 RepID=A0AAD7R188_9TELE|nr:hypothetical protein AAFF_G00169220 [Aldrovandia affinis]